MKKARPVHANQSGNNASSFRKIRVMNFKEYVFACRSYYDQLVSGALHPFPTQLHIVLGNESSDLDSFASALVLAYYTTRERAKDSAITYALPVLCTTQALFSLRGDCTFVANETGLAPASLLFWDDFSTKLMAVLAESGSRLSLSISLVDQPGLPIFVRKWLLKCSGLESFEIVEIVDHHAPDPATSQYKSEDCFQKVQICGSNCTNIAELLESSSISDQLAKEQNRDLYFMLLAAILVDTSGLDPESGKVTERDKRMAQYLGQVIKSFTRVAPPGSAGDSAYLMQLYSLVQAAKTAANQDISLSSALALVKDFKIYELSDGRLYGISSIGQSISRLFKTIASEAKKKHQKFPEYFAHLLAAHLRENQIDFCFINSAFEHTHYSKKIQSLFKRKTALQRELGFILPMETFHVDHHARTLEAIRGVLGTEFVHQLKLCSLSGFKYDRRIYTLRESNYILMACRQKETTFSRKRIQPLLHARLEQTIVSCSTTRSADGLGLLPEKQSPTSFSSSLSSGWSVNDPCDAHRTMSRHAGTTTASQAE